MAGKFNYKKRSYDEAKKQINEAGSGSRDGFLSSDLQLFKPAEGSNKVRIMPPGWEDAEHYGYRIHVHYGIGPNNDAYLCPYNTVNPITGATRQPCPICEERNRVMDTDEDYAKTLRPTSRVLVNLLRRGGKGSKPVIEAWAMPASLDKAIMQQSVDDETQEVLPIDCPEEGYDLDIMREGTGINTKYSVKVARRASEIEDFGDDIWPLISDKKSLAANLIFYDYDYLSNVFSGGGSTKESPKQKQSSKKKIDITTLTLDDLVDMNEDSLVSVIEAMKSDIDPTDYDTLEDLADDIWAELKKMFKKPTERKVASAKKEEPEKEESDEESEKEESDEEPDEEPEKEAPKDSKARLANLRNRNK